MSITGSRWARRTPDWHEVFARFRSQVDWPGAAVWRELAGAFPEAKVIHSVRPAEKWWASFERTIAKLVTHYRGMEIPPHARAMLDAWQRFAGEPIFGGRYLDRETAIAAFERHTAEVTAALPPERLLVFDVAEGWEPLCRFLDRPVPEDPFPHHNLRADFWEALGGEPG